MGTGKESGEIEFAADWLLVLCRDDYSTDEGITPIHLAAAKVRAGRTGWARLDFDGTEFIENKYQVQELKY